jgi:hypothetical protein
MPLRDHFRAPLDDERHWEGFHTTWPVMMVASLCRKLPRGFFAEPRSHLGWSAEIDVMTFEKDEQDDLAVSTGNGTPGGVATAVWAPSRPTLAVVTDLPTQDIFEVQIYDQRRHSRLVAAVEIVSPANKYRPAHRQAFVAKCVGLLRQQVSVIIVDVVTTRKQNLYGEFLNQVGHSDPTLILDPPPNYATACRLMKRDNDWILEAWAHPLNLGKPLPTLPLWLADDLALPLDLEESYEQSCGILNIG